VAKDAEKTSKERSVATIEGRTLGHEEANERLGHGEPNGFHALFLPINDANIPLESDDGGDAKLIAIGFPVRSG
jgi:hypothetical protein